MEDTTMALPTYDKTKRRKSFSQLPKGAYVLKILGAREEANKSGEGSHLTIIFDIAEGEYAGFYNQQFEANDSEDKKWPNDATYYLAIPEPGKSKDFVWVNYNTFFADLEDSNNGFVFGGDVKTLRGKFIGGKFRLEQREYNGQIYENTRLAWTCVADDVRNGDPGKMPNDKLVKRTSAPANPDTTFLNPPDSDADELPF